MVDALFPAVNALKQATKENFPLRQALIQSAEAAKMGMEQTTQLVAHKGNAGYLRERRPPGSRCNLDVLDTQGGYRHADGVLTVLFFISFYLPKVRSKKRRQVHGRVKKPIVWVYLPLEKEVMRDDLQPLFNAPIWLAITVMPFHGRNAFGVKTSVSKPRRGQVAAPDGCAEDQDRGYPG